MKTYALIVDGVVREIIEPFVDGSGNEVPIEERYTAEFVAMLVEYDPANPPLPPAAVLPTLLELQGTRAAYLSHAALAIAPLQDAADLEEATDDEVTLLKKWKLYRVALGRLDLTVSPLAWPVAPDA